MADQGERNVRISVLLSCFHPVVPFRLFSSVPPQPLEPGLSKENHKTASQFEATDRYTRAYTRTHTHTQAENMLEKGEGGGWR